MGHRSSFAREGEWYGTILLPKNTGKLLVIIRKMIKTRIYVTMRTAGTEDIRNILKEKRRKKKLRISDTDLRKSICKVKLSDTLRYWATYVTNIRDIIIIVSLFNFRNVRLSLGNQFKSAGEWNYEDTNQLHVPIGGIIEWSRRTFEYTLVISVLFSYFILLCNLDNLTI